MKKSYFLSLAVVLGLSSAFAASRSTLLNKTIEPARATKSLKMVQDEPIKTGLPTLPAKAPSQDLPTNASFAGEWTWSGNSALGGATTATLTITVTDEATGAAEISGFPQNFKVNCTVDATAGTITIPNNQDLGLDGDNAQNYFYFKQIDDSYDIAAGMSDETEVVGELSGKVVTFPQFPLWAIGDYNDEELGWWWMTYNQQMVKKADAEPVDPDKDPNEGWTSLGNATFQDGWVLSGFGMDQADEANWYEVELQQNDENPNLYRLVNPYNAGPVVEDNQSTTKTGYIEFDATDPDHVIFSVVDAGFAYPSIGLNEMVCYDVFSFYVHKYAETDTPELLIQVFEGDESMVYSTFKDKTLTVPSEAARFSMSTTELTAYSWNDDAGNRSNMAAAIMFPADEPTGMASLPAVTELVDGGTYYIYDSHADRYGFTFDPSATSLTRLNGQHINIDNAYGQLPDAKYVWTATLTESGEWQFQNVGTEHYIGSATSAASSPASFTMQTVDGSDNTFTVTCSANGMCWDCNDPVNGVTTFAYWYAPGHPIQFYQAVSENDVWNFAAEPAYTITVNYTCEGETLVTYTKTGTPGTPYAFSAPRFYAGEAVSGVITKYNLTYNIECTESLPFKHSATLEDATYQALMMQANMGWLVTYDEEEQGVLGVNKGVNYASTTTEALTDNELFAFIGTREEGFKIVNKATGLAMQAVLQSANSGSTDMVAFEDGTLFTLDAPNANITNSNYFVMRPQADGINTCLNMYGTGAVSYWNDADAGSCIWVFGVGQPTINKYAGTVAQAEALGLEEIADKVAEAKTLLEGIDPWSEVPAETVEQLDALLAEIEGVVALASKKADAISRLGKYLDASTTGAMNKDYFMGELENAPLDETLDETIAWVELSAESFFQVDMEAGFMMKNQRSGRYMAYYSETDPNDDELIITGVRSQNEASVESYWKAEFTDDGNSVPVADRVFKLRNVVSNLYVGAVEENNSNPALVEAADAALIKIVPGTDGYQLMIDNGVENNFLNTNTLLGGPLCVYQYPNDGGAFWVAAGVPLFDETQPVEVSFGGEFTEGEYGQRDYTSITSVVVKVPQGAEPTAIGEINAYVYDLADYSKTTILSGKLGDMLEGIEPTQGEIKVTTYDEEFNPVENTYAVDVYTFMLNPERHDAGEYHIEVSAAAFSLATATSSVFSPAMAATAQIGSAALEPFALTVTPAPGIVEELVNITLDSEAGNFNVDDAYTGNNVTLTKDTEVLLDLNGEAMKAFDTWNPDDATAPLFTIPVNATEAGEYTLSIPEGFFTNDATAPNDALTISWTIEEKQGINEITNVSVNGKTIYDLQGRKLNKAVKGINIINGVKTVVK